MDAGGFVEEVVVEVEVGVEVLAEGGHADVIDVRETPEVHPHVGDHLADVGDRRPEGGFEAADVPENDLFRLNYRITEGCPLLVLRK